MAKQKIKVTAIIVEVWPEGNEWNADSIVKKLKWTISSKLIWLGRVLPIKCLTAWVTTPVESRYKKLKILKFLK